MPTFNDVIEMPDGVVLAGTMDAVAFEVGGVRPTHLIQIGQDWGIRIQWEIHSLMANLMDGDWHIQALLERIGADTPAKPDYDLPVKVVPYKSGTFIAAENQMVWDVNLDIHHGEVVPGTYKLVTVLHLYDPSGNPTAICGLDEQRGVITIYEPK